LLLLNIPPDRRGIFHENDVKSLKGFRELLDKEFNNDLAKNATIKATAVRGEYAGYSAQNLIDQKDQTYWTTNDDITSASVEITLEKNSTVRYVVLQEFIELGQRVKSFSVDVWKSNQWKNVVNATTIGHKRILRIDPVETEKIRVNILESKACPVISNVEVY